MKLIQLDFEQSDFSLWGYKEDLNIKQVVEWHVQSVLRNYYWTTLCP